MTSSRIDDRTTEPLHRPFRTRDRKHVSECRDRLIFPSNEERRCPLEEVMKLSMRASEPQCHEEEYPPTACPYTRFLGSVSP